MLYIFGDSHAEFNFKNLAIEHQNYREYSITMHRIGRDANIINFDPAFCNKDNIFVLCYGEIDCRCHIMRQLGTGRDLHEIVNTLIKEYDATIRGSIISAKKIILCSITPPMQKNKYEEVHGPITHEFSFLGEDRDRVYFTQIMNEYLRKLCNDRGYYFLDTYNEYANYDGTLKYEKSDGICHIKDNTVIHEKLIKLLVAD